MGKICKVTLNKETFYANCGDLLLDSAITNGVELPHDCRSGICGSCKVRVVEGKLFGGTEGDMAHACQARVVSDLKIVIEPTPETVTMQAEVGDLVRLAPDVIGVTLDLPKPLKYFPGQYAKVQFKGFPARCYSPTFPMAGAPNDHLLYLHIRQVKDGLVSSALGHGIKPGHKVKVIAPLGTAFFRPKHRGRTILVASGTGFAPMWSIAVAAITENPKRDMVFIVAARTLQSVYMHQALVRLARFPNVKIIPIVSEPQNVSPAIRSGRPTEHMPDLTPDDVVYTCGAPAMTDAIAKIARAAGARCHCDPFVSSAQPSEQSGNLMGRLTGWFDSQRGRLAMLPSAETRATA
jgi:3-phenylpropionate/trans-cinnamate dioxygenase ferredoxin reductase subunit